MSGPNGQAYEDARSAYAPRAATADAKSAQIAVTNANTGYSSVVLTAGVYAIWMKGGLRADVLTFARGSSSTPSLTQATATAQSVHEMPGDWIETIRLAGDELYVWVKYTSAGATVQLSRVGD